MDFKARQFKVRPDSPFDGDLLGRQQEIENLTTLLGNLVPPIVLAVNGRWGAGKTTFVQMWAAQLRLNGFPVLSFNAWTTDFSEDPLVSFLGEMNRNLEEYLQDAGKTNQTWEHCKKLGGVIARRGLPTLVRLATAGLIDGNELIQDEAMHLTGAAAADAVKAYEESRKAIEDFKSALQTVLEEATDDLPLVVFVDELDRCRPTYAIQLLERIKHLFDQPGIVFVLSLDREQLCHSIRAVYGEGLDAPGYLRRFIDFEYVLASPEPEAYIQQLLNSFGLVDYFEARKKYRDQQHDWAHLSKTLTVLSRELNYTLRDIDQLFARVNLALRATAPDQHMYPSLLAFMIVLKDEREDVYAVVLKTKVIPADAFAFLDTILPLELRVKNFPLARLEGYLLAASIDQDPAILKRKKQHKAWEGDEATDANLSSYATTVLDVIRRNGGDHYLMDISELLKRIEMVSKFSFPQQIGN